MAPRRWKPTDDDLQITITTTNSGLAPVQIVSVRLAIDYMLFGSFLRPLEFTNADRYEGPELRLKLEGNHQETWTFDALAAAKRQYGSDPKDFAPLQLELSGPGDWIRLTFGAAISFLNPWRAFYGGIVAVVDLGNGIQIISKPMFSLTFKVLALLRDQRKDQLHRQNQIDP